jgi:hypothetical protein
MAVLSHNRNNYPWISWVRIILVAGLISITSYCAVKLAHHYFGFRKLVIAQVNISGCFGSKLAQLQVITNELCLGKPLFWFDIEKLRNRLANQRWIKDVLIRRDPPDRLSLVINERQPLLWSVWPQGVFLVSDDGIVFGRLSQANPSLSPVPVVVDPKSRDGESMLQLIRVATILRDKQKEFYDRITELRWSGHGPIAFLEGLEAPIYLSKKDATKNIPNFQMLFLNELSKRHDLDQIRYVDLRWGNEIAVGEPLALQSIKK